MSMKRAAVLSPRTRAMQQADELLALRARRAELDRWAAQTGAKVATSPVANSRTQGSRQAYERTDCESCGSTLLLTYGNTNALQCQICRHVSPRFTSVDSHRHPGEVACNYCGSISVVIRERTLYCRVCSGETPRWG